MSREIIGGKKTCQSHTEIKGLSPVGRENYALFQQTHKDNTKEMMRWFENLINTYHLLYPVAFHFCEKVVMLFGRPI